MFCSRRWPLTKQFKLYTLCSCIKKWTNKNLWILPWPRGKFDSIAVVKLFVEKAKFFTTAVLRCYRQDMDRESFKNFCPSRLVFFCILPSHPYPNSGLSEFWKECFCPSGCLTQFVCFLLVVKCWSVSRESSTDDSRSHQASCKVARQADPFLP